jgi:hypothetical protein
MHVATVLLYDCMMRAIDDKQALCLLEGDDPMFTTQDAAVRANMFNVARSVCSRPYCKIPCPASSHQTKIPVVSLAVHWAS